MSHIPTPLLAGLLNLTDIQYLLQGRKPIFPSPFRRRRSFLGLHSRNTQPHPTTLQEAYLSPGGTQFPTKAESAALLPIAVQRQGLPLSRIPESSPLGYRKSQSRSQAFSEALEREDVRSGWGNGESTAWEAPFSTLSLFQPCQTQKHLSLICAHRHLTRVSWAAEENLTWGALGWHSSSIIFLL